MFRISVPILVIGMGVSLLSFFTNERIVPYANFISSKIVREIIYRQPLPEVKENVFFKDPQNRFYFARRVSMKTKQMESIVVYELTDEKYPRVILADTATFSGKLWNLRSGVIHKYDQKGYLNYEAAFSELRLNVSEDVLTFTDQKGAQDMDRKELSQMIEVMSKSGTSTHALQTELLMKYSLPLTCFVFALIGIPFSLPYPRSGRTWGMVFTIVFMFTFYVFASVFRSLGKGGLLPPLIAAFTPQFTFIVIGIVLLYREGWFR
jgi:lipopolysaccharide export system permease protein